MRMLLLGMKISMCYSHSCCVVIFLLKRKIARDSLLEMVEFGLARF